jgi:putative transposase
MIPQDSRSCDDSAMRNLVVLFIHFLATVARLLGPGGARSIVAESLLLKHQLLILNRSRQRSPNLSAWDRILAGLMALLMRPTRLLRSAIVLKPSTLLGLHKAVSKRKYRMLFSTKRRRKPGPKGPSAELIHAVVEMKQRNSNWGCPRIAQQIALAFHIQIDKDVVRRILAQRYRPGQDSDGPSWLTFLGHMKDSLWSIDLFRCESATLRSHWVLVVMDQYTRRIIGFGVHAGTVGGVALCRMFNRAIRGQLSMPKYISSDNDPLYRFHRWQANLRILEVTEIKSIPYVPLSHPFVERLIGTFVMDNKSPDQALDIGILPGRLRSSEKFPDTQPVRRFTKLLSVTSVPVAWQIARCAVPGKGFQQLPSRPFGRRVCSHTEVNHVAPVVRQNHEDKQQVEENRWNHEEVGSDQILHMVLEKCPPCLRRRPSMAHHVLGNRGLR